MPKKSPRMNASHWRQKYFFQFFGSFNTSCLLTTPARTSWVTHVLFVATPMNWEYACPVCGHYLRIHFRVQYNNNIVSTTTYTLFITVMFLFDYYILKLYLPPPGGEESPWMNASHWWQKQTNLFWLL